MRDININFTSADAQLYKDVLIRQGENLASRLLCTIPSDMLGYQYILIFQINNETPIVTTELFPIDGVIYYDITSILTLESGDLKIELHAYENLSLVNQRLIKSAKSKLRVVPSLYSNPEIVPENYVPWYTQVANMYDEVVGIEEHVDEVYGDIVTDELARQEAEVIRVSSENARIGAEALRNGAELIRLANEGDATSGRVKAEADRVDAEALRVIAEGDALSGRVKAEADRVTAEGLRNAKEELRNTAEGLRDTAEGLRDIAETERKNAETARTVFEAYNPATAYVVGNKVVSAGSSYVCIQNGTNKDPATETTYWLLIASGGTGTSVIMGYEEAATAAQLAATDTINEAFGKAQKQLNTIKADIGTQTYTEQNYIADGESATSSIDKLDIQLKDTADLVSTNKGLIDTNSLALSNIATQTDEHIESAMPHQITNLKTGKTYRYGYQISADGIPQVISEEVV